MHGRNPSSNGKILYLLIHVFLINFRYGNVKLSPYQLIIFAVGLIWESRADTGADMENVM
jgi:hypothetical protein